MNRCKLSSFYSFWSPYFLFWNPCKVSWDSLAPAFLFWIYLQTTNMNIFKYSARNLTSVQKSGIIPFVTTYHPAVKNLKQLLMQEWSLTHNQPMLKNIYKMPRIISYRRGKSLKDILVRAKLWRHISQRRNRKDTWGSQSRFVMIFSQQNLNCVKFCTKSASFPFESSRPPCLIFLGIWNTADFVSGLEMSKISGDVLISWFVFIHNVIFINITSRAMSLSMQSGL